MCNQISNERPASATCVHMNIQGILTEGLLNFAHMPTHLVQDDQHRLHCQTSLGADLLQWAVYKLLVLQ